MIDKLRRFFIGLMTAFFFLLVTGNAELFQVLIMTVVCTLGIVLVIYAPILYVIGLGVEKLFFALGMDKIFFTLTGIQPSITMPSELNSADQAVVSYIADARNAGMIDGVIKNNLKENGWATEMIDKAFSIINSKTK